MSGPGWQGVLTRWPPFSLGDGGGTAMSRLFGCMCNEPERLRCALYPARDALVATGAPDGWGLAFFQGGAPAKLENAQPFRFRQWVFCHSGAVERFAAIQTGMLESVPDFLRRNIRGQTDSEHVFHLFLA